MREARMNSFGARVLQRTRYFRERPASVAHVVDNQTIAATHVTDDVHHFRNVSLLTTLIAKSKFGVEAFCISTCALRAAGIRSNDRQIRHRVLLIITDEDRRSIKVVYRYVKEALDLRGVQVHR